MPQRRKTTESSPLPPAKLVGSRTDARDRIQAQISKGRELLARSLRSEDDLTQARADRTRWSQCNHELLLRLFDNSSLADEYDRYYGGVWSMTPTFEEKVHDFQKDMHDKINRLASIDGRLDLIPEQSSPKRPQPSSQSAKAVLRDVFIVHGQDEAARETVARFVMKLNLKPIILAEEPNRGRTIIEKLEASSEVGFVVVLLTADDVGAAKADADALKPRARQNVILELGYFAGKLGRDKVCALYQSGVELPSDYYGVVYVPFDQSGAWRLSLAREIKASGIDVDLNQAM